MKGTRKFKWHNIPYEEISRLKFHNIETGQRFRVMLVEPVDQKDLEKYGTSLLEAEYTIDGDTETTSGLIEHKLDDAPPAFQGIVTDYRRRMLRTFEPENILESILGDLVEAGVATKIPEGALPEGVDGVSFKPKDKGEWKLYGKNSEIDFPFGSMVMKDEVAFEVVGGTPPRLCWPEEAGTIRVVDEDGEKRELNPKVFKLEWRRVAS